MAVLTDILSIKAFRSDKADKALLRQRAALTQAISRKVECEQALQDFRVRAEAEERRLYQGLCGSVVQVRDIDAVRERVGVLKEGELRHEAGVSEAEVQLVRETQALEECRRLQRKASFELDGMRSLADEMDVADADEAEYREETELEDRLVLPDAGADLIDQGGAL